MRRLLAFVPIIGLSVLLASCGTMNIAPPPVPGQVQFSNGVLQAPGATIDVLGKLYSASAHVKTNDLVGVVLNGKGYLVFTSSETIGRDLALSHKQSVQAIADFIGESLQQSAEPLPQGVSAMGFSWPWKKKKSPYDKTLNDGIGVTGLNSGSGPITFANLKDRWIAVQPGDGGKSMFVPPQTWVNINASGAVNAVINKDISEFLVDTPTTAMPRQANYQTYGSVIRMLARPLSYPFVDQANLKQAYDANPKLYMELNGVDFIDALTEAIEHVADFDPTNCIALAVIPIDTVFRSVGFDLLVGKNAAIAAGSAGLYPTGEKLIECTSGLLDGETSSVVTETIAVITSLEWAGNYVKGGWDSALNKSYAPLSVPGAPAVPAVPPLFGSFLDSPGNLTSSESASYIDLFDRSTDYSGGLNATSHTFSLSRTTGPTPTVASNYWGSNVISGGTNKVTWYAAVEGQSGGVVFTNMPNYVRFCTAPGQTSDTCLPALASGAPVGGYDEAFVYATGPITVKLNGPSPVTFAKGWNVFKNTLRADGTYVSTVSTATGYLPEAHFIPYSVLVTQGITSGQRANSGRTVP